MSNARISPVSSEADVVSLYARQDGDGGDTVLLISGMASELESWDSLTAALVEAGQRVLRFDHRGSGRSTTTPRPYTTQQLARDVHRLLAQHELDRVHIVGVSLGGMVAQELALGYPQSVASLTLACTYAAPDRYALRLFDHWEALVKRGGVRLAMADAVLRAFTPAYFEACPEEIAALDAALASRRLPLAGYLGQLDAVRAHDARARLNRLDVPVHVVVACDDILIPTDVQRDLATLVGTVVTEVQGGHGCQWEFPDDFEAAVVGFLLTL